MQLHYFYNRRRGVALVTSTQSLKCMRPSSAALHGIGREALICYQRDLTEAETTQWAGAHRAYIYEYDTLDLLLEDERRNAVPEACIEEIERIFQKLFTPKRP